MVDMEGRGRGGGGGSWERGGGERGRGGVQRETRKGPGRRGGSRGDRVWVAVEKGRGGGFKLCK